MALVPRTLLRTSCTLDPILEPASRNPTWDTWGHPFGRLKLHCVGNKTQVRNHCLAYNPSELPSFTFSDLWHLTTDPNLAVFVKVLKLVRAIGTCMPFHVSEWLVLMGPHIKSGQLKKFYDSSKSHAFSPAHEMWSYFLPPTLRGHY